MAKATLPTIKIEDLKSEATKSLYAGAGVVDLAVEAVREYVADVQKKLVDLQKDATSKFEGVSKSVKDFDFEPKTLRTQVETVVNARVEALSDEAMINFERGNLLDSEAPTPMFLRYSIWIGETARRELMLRSSGSPSIDTPGSIGTGWASTSAMMRKRLRTYSARAWSGMSDRG